MATLQVNQATKTPKQTPSLSLKKWNLWDRYIAYVVSKEKDKIFWYMKVIIAFPCVYMVGSILAMSYATTNFVWFIGLAMLLFFSNVIVHIAELKSRIFIPIYHLSILLLIIIPLITFLIK